MLTKVMFYRLVFVLCMMSPAVAVSSVKEIYKYSEDLDVVLLVEKVFVAANGSAYALIQRREVPGGITSYAVLDVDKNKIVKITGLVDLYMPRFGDFGMGASKELIIPVVSDGVLYVCTIYTDTDIQECKIVVEDDTLRLATYNDNLYLFFESRSQLKAYVMKSTDADTYERKGLFSVEGVVEVSDSYIQKGEIYLLTARRHVIAYKEGAVAKIDLDDAWTHIGDEIVGLSDGGKLGVVFFNRKWLLRTEHVLYSIDVANGVYGKKVVDNGFSPIRSASSIYLSDSTLVNINVNKNLLTKTTSMSCYANKISREFAHGGERGADRKYYRHVTSVGLSGTSLAFVFVVYADVIGRVTHESLSVYRFDDIKSCN